MVTLYEVMSRANAPKMVYRSSTTGWLYLLRTSPEKYSIEIDKGQPGHEYHSIGYDIPPEMSMMEVATEFLEKVERHLNTGKFD